MIIASDTLFAIITFVIMVYNGAIMETRFADGGVLKLLGL
jgi:hypothetical protein